VSFWVLAWRGYSAGCEQFFTDGYMWRQDGIFFGFLYGADLMELVVVGLLLAPIPTALLHVSCRNRLLTIPERSVWLAGLGLVCASGFCFWLGSSDAQAAFDIYRADKPRPTNMPEFSLS